MERKQDIRKRILGLRDALPEPLRREKSRLIQEALLNHPVYERAGTVLCYADFGSEAATGRILQKALEDKKAVYCPKVSDKTMDFYRIASAADLKKGAFGIPEPEEKREGLFGPSQIMPYAGVLIVMPGCVFDEAGHRIGYGGGYYDKYLAGLTGRPVSAVTAALAFELQLLPEIPSMEHDIGPEYIFTEKRVLTPKKYLRSG